MSEKDRSSICQRVDDSRPSETISAICNELQSQIHIPRQVLYHIVRNHVRSLEGKISAEKIESVRAIFDPLKSSGEDLEQVAQKLQLSRREVHAIVSKIST